jgi:hypothetical protein
MSGEPVDAITVLTTRGPLATKRITWVQGENAPRIEAYDRAAFFSILEISLSGPDELLQVLRWLERQPTRLIVRGKPKDGIDRSMARRRVHDRRQQRRLDYTSYS